MTPWSPFKGAPMDGVEIRSAGEKCHVCGVTIQKGERAFGARSIKHANGAPVSFPTFGGGVTLRQTFRHRDCQPS
jgi:hypothetical protein